MPKNRSKGKVLFIIFFTVFLNLLGITIVIPVLAPLFLQEGKTAFLPEGYTFGEITILLGLLKASYPLMQFFSSPLLGSWSDRIGRKRVLSYALAGSFIGYVLFALGIIYQEIALLFIGRIIDGATGGNIAVIYSSIADISEEKEKTKNFGLVGMAFGLGFIIGPFIGGVTSNPEVIHWFDFSTPFWLASLLILINLILVRLWFPETLIYRGEAKLHLLSGLRNFIDAFRFPGFRSIFLVIFLVFLGFTFFTQFFDVFLIEKFDYDQSNIGRLFAYIGVWIAISQGLLTRITSQYFSPRKVLSISILMVSLSLFALLIPSEHTQLLVILPVMSLFHGLNHPNLLTLLSNKAGEDIQGEVLGIQQSLQSLGFTIPPLIAGIIISFDLNLPIIVAGACMSIAWLIFVISFRKRPSVQ